MSEGTAGGERDICDMTLEELNRLLARQPWNATGIVAPPHRGGRIPCELDLAKVREYAEMGLSYATAAPLLGCSRRTLINRINDTPAVRLAWNQGLAWAVGRAAEKLQERVAAGELRAIKYFLSRKGGWGNRP